jgi:hypothetical protein
MCDLIDEDQALPVASERRMSGWYAQRNHAHCYFTHPEELAAARARGLLGPRPEESDEVRR